MALLQNKIDFVAIISAKNANPNGDPLNGNRPRITDSGFGEISDVCLKRKIRNRLMEMGEPILVQSEDNKLDGFGSLSERVGANRELSAILEKKSDKNTDKSIDIKGAFTAKACEAWLDVRSFGQVFAFKGAKSGEGVSIGIRGPVTVQSAFSIDEAEIESIQITKSVNNEPGEKKGSDTMGLKHRVSFGLYVLKGSINVQLAEKTGFSTEDAHKIRQAVLEMFANDASSARPEGSMMLHTLYWFEHNSKLGQYAPARVHDSIVIKKKNGVDIPKSFDDYDISVGPLDGLTPQVFTN